MNSNQPRNTNLCEPTVSSAREGCQRAGIQRTQEPSSSTGVLEVAHCESLTTLGRETSSDASLPLATGQYKGNRNLSRLVEESAGFIVPIEGQKSKTQPEGRNPTSVNSLRCS
jgi:hypothetical protein